MGVDVASFGDFFADRNAATKVIKTETTNLAAPTIVPEDAQGPLLEIKLEGANDKPNGSSRVSLPQSSLMAPTSAENRNSRRRSDIKDAPVKCLVYNDPFSATYKKYIFTADGKHLLGGMMIGDVSDFIKLVAIVKKKVSNRNLCCTCFVIRFLTRNLQKPLDVPPSQFIIGSGKNDDNGDELDDDAQVCSCHVRYIIISFDFSFFERKYCCRMYPRGLS